MRREKFTPSRQYSHTIFHFALDMRATKSNHFMRNDPIKVPIFNSLQEEKKYKNEIKQVPVYSNYSVLCRQLLWPLCTALIFLHCEKMLQIRVSNYHYHSQSLFWDEVHKMPRICLAQSSWSHHFLLSRKKSIKHEIQRIYENIWKSNITV